MLGKYRRFRCYLRSTPGMWEQYSGYVDVVSPDGDDSEVFRCAVRILARTSFPRRPNLSDWRLERIEPLYPEDR